jgi:hypothetical protein
VIVANICLEQVEEGITSRGRVTQKHERREHEPLRVCPDFGCLAAHHRHQQRDCHNCPVRSQDVWLFMPCASSGSGLVRHPQQPLRASLPPLLHITSHTAILAGSRSETCCWPSIVASPSRQDCPIFASTPTLALPDQGGGEAGMAWPRQPHRASSMPTPPSGRAPRAGAAWRLWTGWECGMMRPPLSADFRRFQPLRPPTLP